MSELHSGQIAIEEDDPVELLYSRGIRPDESTITLFAGHSPFQINDHASRSAEELVASIGWTMASLWNHKNFPLFSDTVLVLCPEHMKTIAEDGWSKADVKQFLCENIRKPLKDLRPGKDGGEGAGVSMLATSKTEEVTDESLISKFRKPEHITIIVAGGTAGRFSVAVAGWAGGNYSRITSKVIRT
jgi:hypothetical protein